MPRTHRKSVQNAGFTLVEVMITVFLISMMCLSVFAGLQQVTKTALAVAIRDEGYHLMQDEAERLLSASYANFTAVTAQTITSSVKTSYVPSTVNPLTLPSDNNNTSARVAFTRTVTVVSTSTSATTLQVQVTWTWQGRTTTISTQLMRSAL